MSDNVAGNFADRATGKAFEWRPGSTKIDGLIRLAEERGMPEVAAVLAFTRDNGTAATIGLLAAADRHANAKGLLRRLRTEAPVERAVARIKDGPRTAGEKPWLALEDSRRAERARLMERCRR